MRLVHLADIHLGFRQYQRQTPTGINQREADVGESLQRVIDLHDRKALEWLDKLEDWMLRAEAEVERSVWKNRGERTARQAKSARPK